MALTLLTKLHPPGPSPHFIARPHLLALLDAGIGAKLMLISAPAGTGKSTLLAAWLRQHRRRAAWLSLDQGDNDVSQFLLYLVSALQQLDAGLGAGLPELLQQGQVSAETVLTRLTNDLTRLDDKLVLVLDDYHFLSNPKIHAATEFLLDHLPPQLCLVIATRSDPPLALSRLRVQHQLLELHDGDLRFSRSEAARFLNESQGLDLSAAAIASLEARTEGWIAALQLVSLSLAGRPDKEAFVEAFTGSHRLLVDYLVDEVLSRQPAQIKTFLQRTSVLERFTPSLCEAVTGLPMGRDLLGRLEAANLFLIALDDERRWYRFHHLFAEFLRHRVQADEAELLPELHRRASNWFAGEGWTDEAIRHAFLANDDQLAAQLADAVTAKLALQWNHAQITQYFQQLPAALLCDYPRLCLFYCWFLSTTGQQGALKAALPLLEQSKVHSRYPHTIDAAALCLRANDLLHKLEFTGAAQLCRQALDSLETGEQGRLDVGAHLASVGVINLTASVSLHSNLRQAAALSSVSLALSQQVGSFIGAATSTAVLAQATHQSGQLHEAAGVLREGLRYLENVRRTGEGSGRATNVGELHVMLGMLHYEWNQLGEAEACLQRARALNELYGAPSALALELTASLRLFLARGEPELAQAALHRLKRLSARIPQDDQLLKYSVEVMAVDSRLALAAQTPHAQTPQQGHLLAEVASWLRSRKPGREDPCGPMLRIGHDILARLLLARNDPVKALALLERLSQAAHAEARQHDFIRFLLLQALALQRLGRQGEALSALTHALELAEPEGYCRSLVDLGPEMQVLLEQQASRQIRPSLPPLLQAFPTGNPPALPRPTQPAVIRQAQGEAFSDRERAVLRLLEMGNTHKQIAKELQLSPNTVRWYMKTLYTKLRANNRTEALNRAREMALL